MSEDLISEKDIRGTEETGLTLDCAWNAGKALADWLSNNGEVLVSSIPTQSTIADAVIEGLRLQGRNVVRIGSSPDITARITSGNLAGGVAVGFDEADKVITLTFYSGAVPINSQTGLQDIRQLVDAGNFVPAATKGNITTA